MKMENKRTVLLLGIAGILLATVMLVSPAAASPGNVTGIYDSDANNTVVPGETYIAYNFTYTETSTTGKTNLTWFNITEWNTTATGWTGNNVSFDDIVNISLWNSTGNTLIGNASKSDIQDGFWINISLGNYTVTANTSIYVNITLNTTGLVDGEQIAFNASLSYISNATGATEYPKTEWANDTSPETIEVLNATAGTTDTEASPGGTFVLVGNVTVDPGDDDNAVNLTAITFRVNTSMTNLTAADILNFTLWNDTDNSGTFDPSADTEIANLSSPTDINASFSGLNSTIPANATNRYFLTMNLSKNIPYANMTYQGFVAAQNITIDNGTGPCTATNNFSQLVIKDRITNLTSSVYDAAVLIKVNITVAQGSSINTSTVDLSITNTNTSVVTDIIKDGSVVNGTALANHSLTNGEIRVSMELQEGYYNFSTVYVENNFGGVIANDTTFNGIDFIVNMSGAALNVTPDNPALQDDGVAPRTAEENATINVTVVDKFGHKMVFNESDVNTDSTNITLIKTSGTGTVTITKTTTGFFYPNWTRPVQFNVSDTAAETITLMALDEGPEGLTSGTANQEFTPRIGGVDVYAADGEILADGVDYELVYLQLLDASGKPVPKEGITVGWSIQNQSAAGATVDKGTEKTNASGIAILNITSATVAGKTMTITGWEKFTGSNYADSATVVTKAGAVNNTNSKLYVNEIPAPGATNGTVNTTLNVGVLLRDSSNNPIVGETVILTANTTATFANPTPTSGSDGWANTTVTLPTEVNTTMIRAITGTGNLSATPPELNQTVNVTTVADVVTQISVSPSKSIGLKNVPGTSQPITIQLQDVYGNDNTTATANVLITTDNEELGNMTCDTTTVNNNLWCNITSGESGRKTFNYTVNSSVEGTATLTVNVTDYGFTDTITITTSGPGEICLTFNKTLPLVGETVQSIAQLTDAEGNPLSIGDIVVTFTLRDPDNKLLEVNTSTTNSTGIALYNFTGSVYGTHTVTATNDTYTLSNTSTTTFVGNAAKLEISVNETTPAPNETILINATFRDALGHVTSSEDGETVRFLKDGFQFATATISNGVATATYTQATTGTVDITAFYNATLQNMTTVTFTTLIVLTVNITQSSQNTSCTWFLVNYTGTGDIVGYNVSTDNATWTANDLNLSYKFTGLNNTEPTTLYVRATDTAGQFAYDSITVTSYLGDIDDDGEVGFSDLTLFAAQYGTEYW